MARAIERHRPDHVIVTEPGEWRVLAMIEEWHELFRPAGPSSARTDRFLCTRAAFAQLGRGPQGPAHGALLSRHAGAHRPADARGDEPSRRPAGISTPRTASRCRPDSRRPQRLRFAPDAILRATVLDLVRQADSADHFGDLEPFGWAVTRAGRAAPRSTISSPTACPDSGIFRMRCGPGRGVPLPRARSRPTSTPGCCRPARGVRAGDRRLMPDGSGAA